MHLGILEQPSAVTSVNSMTGDVIIPTGGGIVNSVVAGNGISVNSSDPANPIVTATGGSGSSYFNQTSVDFGSTNTPDSVQLTVSDATVTTDKKIIAQVVAPDISRDLDETEMEQFSVSVGNIVNAISFDIIVTCLTGGANGQYLINYSF
jgi:hypothetical protein